MNRSGSCLLYVLATWVAVLGSADSAAAGAVRLYSAVEYPDCGRILDNCVPVCDWSVPGGGWPLVACYRNVCYRQAGACAASRIPRPGGHQRHQ